MITADSTLFVCPKCGKTTLAIHKKTYEQTVIFFCTNCHLTENYAPSKDAYLDPARSWREFIVKHHQTIA